MNTLNGRRLGAGAAMAVAGLLLAGCTGGTPAGGGSEAVASSSPRASATSGGGLETLSASKILDRAVRTSEAATSVRVKGSGRDHGDTVALDMCIAGRHRASGHIWLGHRRVDVIRIGSVLYVSGNARFWRSSTRQQDVSAFTGKYLKTSTHDKDFADLLALMRVPDLLADVARPTGQVAKKARTTYHGTPAVPLVDEGSGTLYVAATGKPYVLGLRANGERLDFTEYGHRITVHAPPRDRVIPV
ncbi:MAG TPA: hypothetical protein VF053_08520 [Streptosporangiales bacterium]